MATGRAQSRGHGCVFGVLVLAAVIVCVLCLALYGGLFDRFLYERQLETVGQTLYGEAESVAAVQDSRYAYQQLGEEDRQKYAVLLDAFQSREARAYPESDMDDLSRIRDCVIADYPELFYVSGVQKQTETNRGTGMVTSVSVRGKYLCTPEEQAALQVQLDAAVADCLAGVPSESDDYGKAKYLFEYLANLVEYDHATIESGDIAETFAGQTIVDALVNHRAVCAGYARAYQYLLGELGIPCTYITGAANGGTHAWCAALLDGAWYLIDPTWGDPQFLDEGGSTYDSGRVDYDYLCVTTDDMAPTHVAEVPYALPACTSLADNYYVREGLYLEDASLEAAGALLEAAADRGDGVARLRCATRDGYDSLMSALFDEQEIYHFIHADSCYYNTNENIRSIEVRF